MALEPDGEVVSLARRAGAGAIDAAAVVALAVLFFVLPWKLGGFSMPMIGALAAVFGWHVGPLAAFGATPGMRALRLKMVGLDSKRPDAIEVAFRELLGRGLLPGCYLVVVTAGLLSTLVGTGDFHAPGRLGLVLVLASLVFGLVALAGHFVPLLREDRRSLADLFGRTRISWRREDEGALPSDEEARREELAERGRARKIFWGFEAGLLVLALAVPLALGRPVKAHASQLLAERLIRERAEQLFEVNPGDSEIASEVIDRLEKAGDLAGAERARRKHRTAAEGVERSRELKLREGVAKNPGHQAPVFALVELLLEQQRDAEARLEVLAYVDAVHAPSERARCGGWMQEHGYFEDAVSLLGRAIEEGEDEPEDWAWLGLSLKALDRKAEARTALSRAVAAGADWVDVHKALDELGGPEEPAKRKAD
ncbi:MAG: RDD family protein [Myxococcales bacterium]